MKHLIFYMLLLSLTACSNKVVNMGKTINQLSAIDSLQSGDNIPVYDASNGDARKASIGLLQTYMQDNLDFDSQDIVVTKRLTADVTLGYSSSALDLDESQSNQFQILIAVGTHSNITITLPGSGASSPIAAVDKQEITVHSTDIITTVNIVTYTSAFSGKPATSVFQAAGGYFRLRYDLQTDIWYRVG